MDSDKCCDYCPTSHTWACLSRHTADERADALRHQAAHDTTGDVQSSSGAPAEPPHEPSAWETVTNVYDFESAVPRAWPSSSGDDISPISGAKTTSTSTDAESSTARIDAVTETVLQAASGARRAAAGNVADAGSDVSSRVQLTRGKKAELEFEFEFEFGNSNSNSNSTSANRTNSNSHELELEKLEEKCW